MIKASRAVSVRTCSASASTTQGRSVIVVGPQLKLHQCGLPKKMALNCSNRSSSIASNNWAKQRPSRKPKRRVESEEPLVWDLLEEVIASTRCC